MTDTGRLPRASAPAMERPLLERLRDTDKADDFARLEAADEIERLRAELDRVKTVSERRKNKKEIAHIARNDHARGLAYWRERAMAAETKLARGARGDGPMSIPDLIERLKKATGPDRQLDNAIEDAIDLPKPTNFDDLVNYPPYFTLSGRRWRLVFDLWRRPI